MKDVVMPERIAALPRNEKGMPIPYFVAVRDGQPVDFRLVDPDKFARCFWERLCWVCGQRLGVHQAFTVGPMCCINRVSAEPPEHYECANYSVQICPFLVQPRMKRRNEGLPENVFAPDGIALYHNPGTTAIWVTRSYRPIQDGQGGFIFRMGDPERVEWWHQGEWASRQNVLDAIERGLPELEKLADLDGPAAHKELKRQHAALLPLLPEE